MIKEHPVIAWTPYGRRETVQVLRLLQRSDPSVEILGQYIRREHERGIIDEWWLCLNTDSDQTTDLLFAYDLHRTYPWIKLKERPSGPDGLQRPRRHPKQRNTGYFYEYLIDPETVYIRFDDDIVYVHDFAVERLAIHRLEAAGGVASFPIMWNNSIISWYAQQAGVIPPAGTLIDQLASTHPLINKPIPSDRAYLWPKVGGPYCMDGVGWADGVFAVQIHRLLLDKIAANDVESLFFYQDFPLQLGMQFSVSTFASLGSLYVDLPDGPGVLVPYEEEHWHTIHQPRILGMPNIIVGDALVSHYTFFPQGPIVRASDTLERYRQVARELT